MKRVKLASYTGGLDPSGLVIYANGVYTKMNNNLNYPDATPYLSLLSDGKDDLNKAINAAVPSSVSIKSKVIYLQKVLKALKAYVELACGDDEDKAAGSGFAIISSAAHPPKTFAATQGQLSGTVGLECPYAGPNVAYVWELAPDPLNPGIWQLFRVTTTTVTSISGLTAGNKYWFRVKAIVKDKEQPYCDPAMVHVI